MYPLNTPLGQVKITIDNEEIEYEACEGRQIEDSCPDVLGRYQIEIELEPDGIEHTISCLLIDDKIIHREKETGEDRECLSLYSKDRIKLSIGLHGEVWGYFDGRLIDCRNDYDIEYLDKGMSYFILETTKTDKYVFGISWIDNMGYDDEFTEEHMKRDVQTWYGSDPTLSL